MALEPGGIAEKQGNRYEFRWIVHQLLHLLNEKIQTITTEPLGPDEPGVDLWLTHNDGTREAMQCKASNGQSSNWSIADLGRRGLLDHMRTHLDRDPSHRYTLITGVPAVELSELTESTAQSSGNPEEFVQFQVYNISKGRKNAFIDFCHKLNLDYQNVNDIATAYNYLRRMHVHVFMDTPQSQRDDELLVSLLLTGKPTQNLAFIEKYARNTLRAPIHCDDLLRYLNGEGIYPIQLGKDSRVVPAIHQLVQEFEDSISPYLIANELVPRDETNLILQTLQQAPEAGIVIVHGAAGQGKSGVLYELTHRLKDLGIPYLPIRLDRKIPSSNPQVYGERLGLPDSPVLCLSSFAGDRPTILILDQLDALRWTSNHSSAALDVCKQLVHQAASLNKESGKRITIVISCRSFDLAHDPEISTWLKGGKHKEIKITGLSDETVAKVVQKLNLSYPSLQPRQKSLLRSPHNLSLLARVCSLDEHGVSEFNSHAQLMDLFWRTLYRILDQCGISTTDVKQIIDTLVDNMEKTGKLTVSERDIDKISRMRAKAELASNGIFNIEKMRISFSHQSFYDYHIACRLLDHVDQMAVGLNPINEWLKSGNQSLIRREQLRLLLALIADEDEERFVTICRDLLSDVGIRFHIKHLVLAFIGQVDAPWQSLFTLANELLNQQDFRQHALTLIYVLHLPYINKLIADGVLSQWLCGNEQEVNTALWLLRSIIDTHGDIVLDLIEPLAADDATWQERLQNLITYLWGTKDTDRIFQWRLRFTRQGILQAHCIWKELAAQYPLRAIQLMEALLSLVELQDIRSDYSVRSKRKLNELSHLQADDASVLTDLSQNYYRQVLGSFIPHILRLTSEVDLCQSYIDRIWDDTSFSGIHDDRGIFYRLIVPTVTDAGREFASHYPDEYWMITAPLRESPSIVIQRILIESYAALPAKYADHAVQWLMQDPHRLAIGAGIREPEWKPTARFIAKLSPFCSVQNFAALERMITYYHAPEERIKFEMYCNSMKYGCYRPWFGAAQHFLLPALCHSRRSRFTEESIGVYERKFEQWDDDDFLVMKGPTGGAIGSKLRSPHLLSNREWLRIINDETVPIQSHKYIQVSPGTALEASVEQFSRSLCYATSCNPDRFANLLQQFSSDTHPSYVAAIIDGLREHKPQDSPDDWHPASSDALTMVTQFLNTYPAADEREIALAYCRLIERKADECISQEILECLCKYATTHPDPDDKRVWSVASMNEKEKRDIVHDLENLSLNCVRSAAAYTLGRCFERNYSLYEQLRPCIEHLVTDPHPAVRLATLATCIPILNFNIDQAVEWLLRVCQNHPELVSDHIGRLYFNNAIPSHFDQLAPIIRSMADHEDDGIAQNGAGEIAGRWCLYGLFDDVIQQYATSERIAHRKGIAAVAAMLYPNSQYRERSFALLKRYYNDPEKEVRAGVRNAFFEKDVLQYPDMPAVINEFCKSKAFTEEPDQLLYRFEEYTGSLVPFTESFVHICNSFIEKHSNEEDASGAYLGQQEFTKLILRLYEQTEDPTIRGRCLDVLDLMFKHGLGNAHQLIDEITD